jgi:hypothetical protein
MPGHKSGGWWYKMGDDAQGGNDLGWALESG